MNAPRFITFEGIDGAGKSTHLAAVEARLRSAGASVRLTREPGGTPLAERVREIFLNETADVLTEALLAFAARRDHLRQVIRPALQSGDVVLCDRFTDATFAYQGAGGASLSQLAQLEDWVQEGLEPDLTVWFDLPPQIAAERRAKARAADRFEERELAFFEKVRAGYAGRAESSPKRFVRIDASKSIEEVWKQVATALETRGW